MKIYDIIIIGGGPSGASAGRLAGKLGLKTLLLEKEIFPRYKPCGGALSEQAISYLDFQIPRDIQERDIYGARVHYAGTVVEKYKKYRISTLVTRSTFDNFLLEKSIESGIEVKMGEKVIDYKEQSEFIDVYTTKEVYRSKFLIISEGYQGILSNRIRERESKDRYGICVVTEIEEDNRVIDEYIYNAIEIHFGVANWGYGWIFPHEGYFSVGIGGLAKDLKNPKKVFYDFCKSNGFLGEYRIKGHKIPAGGFNRNMCGLRTLLTGDAAGFVDPFYGEGIAYAIISGQIAVDIISKIIIGEKEESALSEYKGACYREFGGNLKYSLYLSFLMHRFPNLFFKIFTSNDEILDKYLEVPAVRVTYKEFITWLLPRIPKYLLFH